VPVGDACPTAWQFEWAARTDCGLVRRENQDAYGVFTDLGLFLVADGLGGHRGGQVASRMAVDVVRTALASGLADDVTPVTGPGGLASTAARRLLRAFEDANASIWNAAREPERHGMGTTIVALLFDPDTDVVAVCHVGDSRMFRVRGDEITQLTEDHTMVQRWVREGRIGPEEAAISPHRHVVTHAVGTQRDVQPAVHLERPQVGDVFLLTSDGVHDGVTPAEMAAVVRAPTGGLEEACQRLVDVANERGGVDNATIVMVRVRGCPSGSPVA
jgi:serine/threonine protein phosphatase PrpC